MGFDVFDGDERSFNFHLEELEKSGVTLKNIAAFFVESFQGWVIFIQLITLKQCGEWANKNGLLVFDEIQAGFGRTGKCLPMNIMVSKQISSFVAKAFPEVCLSAVLGSTELIEMMLAIQVHMEEILLHASGLGNLEAFEKHNLIDESNRKGNHEGYNLDWKENIHLE